MEIQQWLDQTRAKDLMTPDVVSINMSTTMEQAAQLLLHEQVYGAPVVDDHGRCLGIISASGILSAQEQWEHGETGAANLGFYNAHVALPAAVLPQRFDEIDHGAVEISDLPVNRFMSTDLVSVAVDASAREVLQDLIDAHVHRILVLDEKERLQGIISTIDVLAGILRG